METPHKRAIEIYNEYYDILLQKVNDDTNLHELAKECAIYALDIITTSAWYNVEYGEYFREVKQEIKYL